VGLATSLNIRFQGHTMKLVEVEGSHTMQSTYSSLDVHLGQSYSVLVTADQPGYDYAIVVSTRFTTTIFSTTAVLHYANSAGKAPGPMPGGPTIQIDWSLNQARSIRWNLTASGPRPNPQGSYHYGLVPVKRTIVLANSAAVINGKQRYAVNRVSYVNPDTPLKLADYYKIPGVFNVGTISDNPSSGGAYLQTSVMGANYRDYVEIVFQNDENEVQSWHIDGSAFWVVGYVFLREHTTLCLCAFNYSWSSKQIWSSACSMDGGKWSPASRQGYNLRDGVSRYTVQVRYYCSSL
jgi:FtsP/CotA-like multicopper oxidase with cupredoxin domain